MSNNKSSKPSIKQKKKLPMEKKLDLHDEKNHRHNCEEEVIYEKGVMYKTNKTNGWKNGWCMITREKDGKIYFGCDNKNDKQCGKVDYLKGFRLIPSRFYDVTVLQQIPHCLEIATDIKCSQRYSFIYQPRLKNKNRDFYFAALNAVDFINWAFIIGQCANGINLEQATIYAQDPFLHYDAYDEKNNAIFKSLWSNFKEYRNQSIANKSYNPTVTKFIIPKTDFNDINISNFIVFYVKKYGNNDKLKLNEFAQYLSHCFKYHNGDDDLSKGFELFPKAYFTWYAIHKKNKNIRVVNIPTIHSNSIPLSHVAIRQQYPVKYFPFYQPQPYGYFAAKQILDYSTPFCIRKLKKYYGDKTCPESIINCFEKNNITDSYFIHHKRKDFVQLLKRECNVSGGEAIKIWNYFKKGN